MNNKSKEMLEKLQSGKLEAELEKLKKGNIRTTRLWSKANVKVEEFKFEKEHEFLELKLKIDNRTATKKEVIEFNKLDAERKSKFEEFETKRKEENDKIEKENDKIEKIVANKDKINNVLELKKILNKEALKIEKEIFLIDKNLEANKEVEKLDKELAQLLKKAETLNESLKKIKGSSDKDSVDKRNKIEEELKSVNEKIDICNENYVGAQNKKEKITEKMKTQSNYSGLSMQELNKKYNVIKNKVARCDLALVNLLAGKSWDDIDKKLEGFENRKFSARDETNKRVAKYIKNVRESKKEISKEKEDTKFSFRRENKAKTEIGKNEGKENKSESKELIEQSEFAKKHPRLAKIGNWFKNIFKRNNIKNEEKVEEIGNKKGENLLNKNQERIIEELVNSNQRDFKKELRDYAEKGMNGIEEDRRNSAKERLEEIRKKAQDSNRYEIDANGVKHDNFQR